ncbi:uncharacterized protein BDZ99DRAFT_463998 [Mytilinidion resinicola]|uniref:Uncharacterized protein n=1 Tax=Mytilinidion resinicola TaxID=574789 RepID=A0A6A6YK21_9PEZI|nr:uncharacterized protein BDZ99DRAFT_463998 [Mytilinidion resinicola]KAF2809216.1 hypothetical protein BDZ99DRAFT_463998 [Mytilinidion resinicola]
MADPDAEEHFERWLEAEREAHLSYSDGVISSYLRLTPDAIEAHIRGSREQDDHHEDYQPYPEAALAEAPRRELRDVIEVLEAQLYKKDTLLRAKDDKMSERREKFRLLTGTFTVRMGDMQKQKEKLEEELASAIQWKNEYKASSKTFEEENTRLRSEVEIKATALLVADGET